MSASTTTNNTTTTTATKFSWNELDTKGAFIRTASQFRNWIKADGSTPFTPEVDRYHLYVSHACPWAHRTMIVRSLKGLQDVISYSVVHHFLGAEGWTFASESEVAGCVPDFVNNFTRLKQVYLLANPEYTGKTTVPVLFDKKLKTIVNNESSEIIRMLNSEFNSFAKNPDLDLYPENLRSTIDENNEWIYPLINNGVYRCGFATTQVAYDEAFQGLFSGLDRLEAILSTNRFICGNTFTEADVRAFTTLLRFDPVYVGHFKCNKKRIVDYPGLWRFVREMYHLPGVAETINMEHIKKHYYGSHKSINPTGIVPNGPELDYSL